MRSWGGLRHPRGRLPHQRYPDHPALFPLGHPENRRRSPFSAPRNPAGRGGDPLHAPAGTCTAALHNLGLVINTAILVAVVLFWAGTIKRMEVIGLAAQSLRLATPIGLGAMAGILCERCGVVNIAIEGMMLTAACIGFMICLWTPRT
jgi:hypothetical protein